MKRPSNMLATLYNIGGNAGNKLAFHRQGRKFLTDLRDELGLTTENCDIRSNLGGSIVSGELTLHSDSLYVQMYESALRPGIQILFRSCNGRKDYTGGWNNFVYMKDLFKSEEVREFFVRTLRVMASAPK